MRLMGSGGRGLRSLWCSALCGGLLMAAMAATPAPVRRAQTATVAHAGRPTATGTVLSDACLLWPFENRSGDANLDWIGESFVIMLRQQLRGGGVEILSRNQWLAALKLVGAPEDAQLSHATLIRIAGEADANWLVTGWYDYDGDQFRAGGWVFDLKKEHLVTLAAQSGRLADLEKLQLRLAWAVRQQMEPEAAGGAGGDDEAALPLPAYESYVRSQLTSLPAEQLRELNLAVHLAPHDARILFALGQAELAAKENAQAMQWLQQVPKNSADSPRARFDTAVAAYRLGNYARAAELLRGLEMDYPLPAVSADLALAEAQRQRAATPAPALQLDFPVEGFQQLQAAVRRLDASKAQALPLRQRLQRALENAQRLQAAGGWDAAALQYQQVIAGSGDPQMLAAAHAGLAAIWLARHNPAEAAAEVKQALAADAGNVQARALQRDMAGAGRKSGGGEGQRAGPHE